MAWGNDAVIAEGEQIAGHGHDFGIAGADDLDLAVGKESFEGIAQNVDTGDGQTRAGHAEQDVEM